VNIYAPKKPKLINSVSVTVTLFLLVLGYFLWAFVPIYWPVFQLKGIIRAACNHAYRELDDDAVIAKLVKDSRRTGLDLTEENFRMRRIPMTEEEIRQEAGDDATNNRWAYLRKRGKECVIEYYYRDRYELPLVGQSFQLTFHDDVHGSLETVTW